MKQRILILIVTLFGFTTSVGAGEKQVTVQKTPGQGIQPQVATDAQGNVHLLYFQGDARNGNLMYTHRAVGKATFADPLRVNSQTGSAIAIGTMRGGQIAVGKKGRVHVAWNGSQQALPKNPIAGTPMLYARLNDDSTAFEPQRNLMTQSAVLDGGGALAADGQGNVYVAWHGLGKEMIKGEDHRRVWVSLSHDEGKTFDAEKLAWQAATGACGCCGMRGFADPQGNIYFLYRGAAKKVERGMYLLRSQDQGNSFAGKQLDEWNLTACPMSSEAFAAGPSGVYAAWETKGQIYFGRIQSGKVEIETVLSAPGKGGDRQHPALAVNKKGEILLAWTEGTGWNRGGTLAWQVFDQDGKRTAEAGRLAGGIPVWGLPAVLAESDGRFTIWH